MNTEMERVWHEAQGQTVTVNGWQEGLGNVPGFVLVTDQSTCTTFAVKRDQPLLEALNSAQARMAAGRSPTRPPEPGWLPPVA